MQMAMKKCSKRERDREREVAIEEKKRSNDEQTQVPGFMFDHGD